MAQIDLGKYGRASPVTVATPIAKSDAGVAWDAAARLGRVGMALSKEYLDETNRGKIGLAVQAHDEVVDKAAIDATNKMQSGALSPMQAEDYFRSVLDQVEPEEIPYLSPDQEAAYQLGLRQSQQRAMHRVLMGARSAAETEQNRIARAIPDSTVRAATVAADPEVALEQLRASARPGGVLANAAGPEYAAEIVADTESKVYEARARNDLETYQATGDAVAVGRMQKDLLDENSLTSRRLGPRRSAVLSQVTSTINQLTNTADHAQRARETAGARTVKEYADGMKLAVRYSADQISAMRAKVAGTEAEPLFNELLESQDVVHKAATSSPEANASTIMDLAEKFKEAQRGGDTKLAEKLNRLLAVTAEAAKTAAERGVNAPIELVEARTGNRFADIGPQDLADPTGLAAKLKDRAVALDALRSTPGFSKVSRLPLKPQEATALSSVITGESPERAAAALNALLQATDRNQPAYSAILSQITEKGAEAIALAGLRLDPYVKGYAGPEHKSPTNVGVAILNGMGLLGLLEKKPKGETEAKVGALAPSPDVFRKALGKDKEHWFKAIPVADQPMVLDAARAYYASMLANHTFSAAPEPNTQEAQAQTAIRAVAGNAIKSPVGNGSVLVPWGMATDDFIRQMEESWAIAGRKGEVDPGKESARWITPVPGSGGLSFYFLDSNYVPIRNNKDKSSLFTITVTPPKR